MDADNGQIVTNDVYFSGIQRLYQEYSKRTSEAQMNAWEAVPFEAFTRQSRVTINVQKDLEDMLNKLDRPQDDGITEQEEAKRLLQHRRKRKFLELAVPVGVVALLCLSLCMVYLVETGHTIVVNRKVHQHFLKFKDLDNCGDAITEELSARKDFIESNDNSKDHMNEAYDLTDIAMYKIAPGSTKQEWRLSEKLHQHRHNMMKEMYVLSDGLFYSDFIQEVLKFGFSDVNRIEELHMWKQNYNYIKLTKQIYSVKPMIVVINYTCTPSDLSSESAHRSSLDTMPFLEHAEGNLNKMKLNDSSETSLFLRTSENIFGNFSEAIRYPVTNSIDLTDFQDIQRATCNETLIKLSELLAYKLKRRQLIFTQLRELNSTSIRRSILIFCSILIAIFITVLCTAMFGHLLRYECQVSISVSDWLEKVMNEVKEHELYRESVLKRICPQVLRDVFDPNARSAMLPYYVSDATMAMLSIFNFKDYFLQFTAAQAVQILSFIMDLLDERMSQYTVFPVAKAEDEQIVVSAGKSVVYYMEKIRKRSNQKEIPTPITEIGKQLNQQSDLVTPRRGNYHACVIANMALDILSCCNDIEVGNGGGAKLQLIIAIHSGPCTGMLYIRHGKICFKMTGNSVQVLRKLHRLSTPNRIQVTDTTHKLLSKSEIYSLNCRGQMEVNGVSEHTIYWLNGRKVSVSAFQDCESHCSRIGSWMELEKRPLYKLDEEEGGYTPIDKSFRHRTFSIVSSSLELNTPGRYPGSQGPSSDTDL